MVSGPSLCQQGLWELHLDRWIQWARRSRLAPFVKLARTITEYRASIAAALRYGLSNARVERGNQKIRLIIRRSFRFHYPAALIALAKLSLGGLCPSRPRVTHGNVTSAPICRARSWTRSLSAHQCAVTLRSRLCRLRWHHGAPPDRVSPSVWVSPRGDILYPTPRRGPFIPRGRE